MAVASFRIDTDDQGRRHIRLFGQWSLRAQENNFAKLKKSLSPFFSDPSIHWDLQAVEQLDTAGATMLWIGWDGKLDARMALKPEQIATFDMLSKLALPPPVENPRDWFAPVSDWGNVVLTFFDHVSDFIQLIGLLLLEIVYLLRHPRDFPWREFCANIYKSGVTALPVSALLGFMIGVAMSYLMSKQVRTFGADIFIVNILGLSIMRELGPILMAVLIAGRSGSAMTAQIGVMRVTEEIDALATMGISKILRVILPKILGLTFVAPFLVLWTSGWALAGGALSANIQLDINYRFFFDYLPSVVQPVNLTIGLVKGLLFGSVVALVACHFGLRIKPNTESLSINTTNSVVTAITSVILINAWFAIATRGIGI
ncbi:MAG: ABC transporter permease [Methylotenera sp.]|nr:ABC transporter permease [Methylotenera sp.]